MEQNIPSKLQRSGVKRMIRKKARMYKKAKISNSRTDWDHFKSFRKSVQKKIRASYWSYTIRILNDPDDKHKKSFWRFIKVKRQDNTGISPLIHNNKTVSDNKGKAKILNTQFKSVLTSEILSNLPSLGESPFPDIQHIQVSVEGVRNLLKETNISKPIGADSIPARILKEMADEISTYSHIHLSAVLG